MYIYVAILRTDLLLFHGHVIHAAKVNNFFQQFYVLLHKLHESRSNFDAHDWLYASI